MKSANLPFSLDRTVLIRARRATVFSFFTDNARFAAWWGQGSTIEPRPGGAIVIRYPNGIVGVGEVLEIERGERIVFTFGFESGTPIPAGGSRVTVTLRDDPHGTQVDLHHEVADAGIREHLVQGWRYQLSVFATVAAAAEHAGAERTVDAFFAIWNETDAGARATAVARCCTADVAFHDPNSALAGHGDLVAHVGAAQQFFPGVRLARRGAVRQCQGTVLADWEMQRDGKALGAGTNVFELAVDGRVHRAVGLPQPAPAASQSPAAAGTPGP
jgi:uncharacterized protein YndB with AHSA1/START domain